MVARAYDPSAFLDAWPIGAVRSVERTPQGSIHHVYRVLAAQGEFYLRVYRYAELQPIACEHDVIRHVRTRGIPAVAPLPTADGSLVVTRAGRSAALFPCAPGAPLSTVPDVRPAASGAFLARVHTALASFPLQRVARRSMQFDRAATLHDIARYEALIVGRSERVEADELALLALSRQRAWLLERPQAPPAQTADAQQAIHGDYNAANLFALEGRIVAIIDWDQAYQATCGWEVMRALDILLGYDAALCVDFVAGYRAERALSLAELDRAAQQYAWMRAHDLWKFSAIYEQGNERIRAFLPPQGFIAHDQCWQAISAALPAG